MLILAVAQLALAENLGRIKALGFIVGIFIVGMLNQGTGTVSTCHCKKNSTTCPKNGYCETGCELGFYGPGCQMTNVAYQKEARQSSTYKVATGRDYSAGMAVDGVYDTDPTIDWAPNCSHTAESNTTTWWQVILSVTKTYIVYNISVVNRADPPGKRLRDFKIYVSNHHEVYPRGNWTFCAEQLGEAPFITNFTCRQALFSQSVAIVQNNTNTTFLALCEVTVGGYEHSECGKGYTGPGCLLRSCDNQECANGGKCGPMRSCIYERCPRKEHLPPDCWITLPNFAFYVWRTQVDGNLIRITGAPTELTNIEPNTVVVNVSNGRFQLDYSARIKYEFSSSGSLSILIESENRMTLGLKIIPKHCVKDKLCPDENTCFEAPACIEGASSDWIIVKTARGAIINVWKTIELNIVTVAICMLYYFSQL